MNAQNATVGSVPWFDDNPAGWQGPDELNVTPSPWDVFRFTVSGIQYSFIGEAKGSVGSKLDVKSGIGKPGESLQNNGRKNTPIEITLFLQTLQILTDFNSFVNAAFACSNNSNAKTNFIIVDNPALALYQATKLYFYEAHIVEPPRDGHPASVKLLFHQFTEAILGVTGGPVQTAGPGAAGVPAPKTPTPPSSSLAPPGE